MNENSNRRNLEEKINTVRYLKRTQCNGKRNYWKKKQIENQKIQNIDLYKRQKNNQPREVEETFLISHKNKERERMTRREQINLQKNVEVK